MRVGGIVLCGGRSARMGTPKAWLPVGGEVLLQRTVRTVGAAASPVVVVAAVGQAVPPLPAGVAVVRDEVADRGPLAGLAAGLAALGGRADAAYLSACDAPLLSAAFVRRMVALFLTIPATRRACARTSAAALTRWPGCTRPRCCPSSVPGSRPGNCG